MRVVSQEIKEERGWFYKGKIKYFYRNCNQCGDKYTGQGSQFCSYSCTRLYSPIIMRGKDNPMVKNPELRIKLSKIMKGRKPSVQTIEASIKAHKGFYGAEAKNGRWKGGKSSPSRIMRQRVEWKDWRKSVYERDNYQCIDCGLGGNNLEPHHIIPLKVDLTKAYNINNGITLCRPCHMKTFGKEEQLASTYTMFTVRQVN